MRKSLICMAMLLALGIFGVTTAALAIDEPKDDVRVKATTLFGDPSQAQGAVISSSYDLDRHLFWDITYACGSEPAVETDFAFHQQRYFESSEPYYSGFQIETQWEYITSGDISEEQLSPILRDVAGRTEPGTEHEEIIRVKDYYDFYPLGFAIDLPGFSYRSDEDWAAGRMEDSHSSIMAELNELLPEYFKVPVEEDHRMSISVRKNLEGTIVGHGSGTVDENFPSLYGISAYTDDWLWFTFEPKTGGGRYLDMSRLPDGYGLFRFSLDASGAVVPAGPELAYPLKPAEQDVRSMYATADGRHIVLLTYEPAKGGIVLRLLDAHTGEVAQELTVMETEYECSAYCAHLDGEFAVVADSTERFTVLEVTEDGLFEPKMQSSFEDAGRKGVYLSGSRSMDWDGEKLLVAAYDTRYGGFRDSVCAFGIAVYDAEGLRYCGLYRTSLVENNDNAFGNRSIQPSYSYDLLARWGG